MQNTVILPAGYLDGSGGRHRIAELRALSGYEEEMLVNDLSESASVKITRLISSCVSRIGDISPVSETVARALLVSDRQFLLLRLRALTFGDAVNANTQCPRNDCGAKVDVDFRLSSITHPDFDGGDGSYPIELSPEARGSIVGGARRVRFRLPNGGDQEAMAELESDNEAEAVSLLLSRCILDLDDNGPPQPEAVLELSSLARREIEQKMRDSSPDCDLTMETVCPECHNHFSAPFDVQEFFFLN